MILAYEPESGYTDIYVGWQKYYPNHPKIQFHFF
jgi:hypothetical protein